MNRRIAPAARTGTGALALLAVLTVSGRAEDWPQWRGPSRDGVSKESIGVWTGRPEVAWEARVGTGFASFAVQEGRAYTLGHEAGKDVVWCLDARTGVKRWDYRHEADLGDDLHEGGPAATPTLAGGRVYALNKWGTVLCLDAKSGKLAWRRDLRKEEGIRPNEWGLSGSPLIWKDRVLLNAGGAGIALDRSTGKTLWINGKESAGYASPLLFQPSEDEGAAILVFAARELVAVDPSAGEIRWRQPWRTGYDNNNADPVVSGRRVFITSYDRGAACLEVGERGGTDGVRVLYDRRAMNTHMAPPVLVGEYLYGFSGHHARRADFRCVELASGEVRWREGGLAAGSVMVAGGKLLVLDGRGELVLAEPSPRGFRPLARSTVLEGRCWTPPALAGGRLYVRNARGLARCLLLEGS